MRIVVSRKDGVLIVGALTIIAGFLVFFRSYNPLYLYYLMPADEAAIYLFVDRKAGGRVVPRIKSLGDRGLIAMQLESDEFRKLDNRNSRWVTDVLVHSDSDLAKR